MSRRAEGIKQINPNQLGFKVIDLTFVPVLPFSEFEEVKQSTRWLETRTEYREAMKKKVLFLDLAQQEGIVFENGHWDLPSQFRLQEIKSRLTKHQYNDVVIITSSFNANEYAALSNILGSAQSYLHTHKGDVFVCEEKPSENIGVKEKKIRQKILREHKFVKAHILTPPNNPFVFWQGSQAKKREFPNMLQREWVIEMIDIMLNRYKEAGYDVVLANPSLSSNEWRALKTTYITSGQYPPNINIPALLQRLSHSSNTPDNLQQIVRGTGVLIRKKNCGLCTWDISLDGTETNIASCNEDSCDKLSPGNFKKYKSGQEQTTLHCPECKSFLVNDYSIKDRGRLTTRIQIETRCPTDGIITLTKKKVFTADVDE